MNAFVAYPWPGNVRELQNLIERAVIRSDDGVLPNPLPLSQANAIRRATQQGTLREYQATLILRTLRAAGGMIGGPRGAAARLGLKRTTLLSKMKRLGIYRPRYQRLMSEFEEEFASVFSPLVEAAQNQDLEATWLSKRNEHRLG